MLRLDSAFPIGDFFALWSYAHILVSHPASVLYDAPALHALQVGMGLDSGDGNPYAYPPHAALLLLPVAGLGYWAAAAVWLGGGLALYVAAVAAGRDGARWMVLAAVLAPTTALNLAFGQGGFLVAALLIGGLRLAPVRPVLAGVLFGVLTFKPQFGLMVPIALIAAGHWRCLGAAVVGAVALAVVATVWQGADIWEFWLASLPQYQAWFAGRAMGIMPTVQASLLMLRAPHLVAHGAQGAAAVLAAACVWRAWRGGHPCRVPIALAATALATPHAFIYDLPLLSGAAILFAADRLRSGLGWAEGVGLAAVLVFPIALNLPGLELPIAGPMLLMALGLFWRTPATLRHARISLGAQPA